MAARLWVKIPISCGGARLLHGNDTRAAAVVLAEHLADAACRVAVAPHGYAEHPRRIEIIGVEHDGRPASATALIAPAMLAARHARCRAR